LKVGVRWQIAFSLTLADSLRHEFARRSRERANHHFAGDTCAGESIGPVMKEHLLRCSAIFSLPFCDCADIGGPSLSPSKMFCPRPEPPASSREKWARGEPEKSRDVRF
jgi:hypothetical protein